MVQEQELDDYDDDDDLFSWALHLIQLDETNPFLLAKNFGDGGISQYAYV